MKVFNFVRFGAYIVLACNIVISYYHCLQLFQAVSHAPVTWLTHVGVVSLDAVFILSVVVLTESRGRGVPPWLCFTFGLCFTTWSNIRGALVEHNWEGVAVGASTVCALLLIKIMLTWMEGNRHLFARTEEEAQSAQDDTEEPAHDTPELVHDTPDDTPEPVHDTEDDTEDADEPVHDTPNDTETVELLTDMNTIRAIAEREKEKTGDYPSIRALANIAPCKEWRARRVLAELKKPDFSEYTLTT